MYLCQSEVDEEEKKKVDFTVKFWFCCRCCLCIILLIILILCLLFANSPKEEKSDKSRRIAEKADIASKSLSDELWMTYSELDKYCKNRKSHLPLPRNQTGEDNLLAQIISNNNLSCKFIFLGYQANKNVRYQSLKGEIKWPSLKIKLNAGIPTAERDCLHVHFEYDDRPRVLFTKKCGVEPQKCFLYLTNKKGEKYCERYRYRCADQLIGEENSTVGHFNDAKNLYNYSGYTMLMLDPTHYPQDLEFDTLYRQHCVALAVKYIFKYEYQNLEMPYRSTRFTVTDPEYDCVALNIEKRTLVTISCHEYACPYCV